MEMDKSEIAVSFRLAKDKKAQIETLADLNLCSPYEIAKVLDEMGELQGSRLRLDMFSGKKQYRPVAGDPAYAIQRPASMARGRPHKPVDEERAMELWLEGASDQEMMAALGATYWAVTQWRSERGLRRFKAPHTRKKEKSQMQDEKQAAPVAEPEPEEVRTQDAAPITMSEFLARLTELTPPAALKAPLRINGALVMEIARIVIHGARDETPSVEIVTEG